MPAESLQELLSEELKDLYDAEKQLTKALPKIAKAADSDQIRAAFEEHLEVTKSQVARLEEIFQALGEKPKSRPCKGMKGLLDESQEHLEEYSGARDLIDSVLIDGGKKVEHYEIAGYNSAIELAEALGHKAVSRLLRQTLTEEERMDKKLDQLGGRLLKKMVRQAA
ncbi:MAG TPA: ferritin-like domain-containing protein [Bryobacteraceae bacterium]|nr:ferritin-like domain-containing protein [Bryobacteraceae bacterium]HOL70229.1 ferritin-like domain-containing protein [Bryobacteraceae bacterium]HOQ45752.1 ferritin-like domain-containing protein [Bryobacteraceae bacterium]HPQ13956.1 ferritin-like domain-containing protein [Bryobacteraceae bacterium]HPU71521.1 ferritin-like domain-containing protein [Bryobacteraceae bacterium]